MKFSNRQRGLGVAGWLILIVVFGGITTIGMKLVPLYLDHNTMSNIIDGVAAEPNIGNKRNIDIQEMIINRFKINNIRDFDWKKNLVIKRDSEGVKIILDYEARVPLAGNVDLMAKFYKEANIRT